MKRQIRIIYQHDSMQCGIACLQMICGYYGKKYSSEYLSKTLLRNNGRRIYVRYQ